MVIYHLVRDKVRCQWCQGKAEGLLDRFQTGSIRSDGNPFLS
jgi:hypothetical protein